MSEHESVERATGTAAPHGAHALDLDLFLISFAILFLELACIRWFGSTVIFLTYFTNIVLLACFLGMSVGSMLANRPGNLASSVLPLCAVGVAAAWNIAWLYQSELGLVIDVGRQSAPELIYFGAEYRTADPTAFIVPIELVAGLFFVLISLMFVGLGQVLGRAFAASPDRVRGYLANVLGSIAGIVAFGALSYLETSPLIWFAVALALILRFVPRLNWLQLGAQMATLIVVAMTAYGADEPGDLTWSPYYKILHNREARVIVANNIGHQEMKALPREGELYLLPHMLLHDSVTEPSSTPDASGTTGHAAAPAPVFEDVLVIGAGSGNDVTAALLAGARHVDAVEIDPAIYRIGRDHHPNRPYLDPRVEVHLDDGRGFLRRTDRQYDLVVYALVDSLVLHSAYSSLRLESFLFTEEAFRDIARHLKPGGLFAMYNYYRQGWVVGRLVELARRSFGSEPLVLSLPPLDKIAPEDSQAGHYTVVLAGRPPVAGQPAALDSIRAQFAHSGSYWLSAVPAINIAHNSFGAVAPSPLELAELRNVPWMQLRPTAVETAGSGRLPDDNWPFLYLRRASIPAHNVHGMLIIAALSLLMLLVATRGQQRRLSGRMFFLGAGFMLLETKGVVHMALLFGSTWMVNSVVFLTILLFIALANLFVLRFTPRRLWPAYVLVVASLALNMVIPMASFLSLDEPYRTSLSCLVVFAPVFFAGVIFATAFRDSAQPDLDYGSNVAGVILGGLAEYFSLVVGFNGLIAIALGFYLLSWVLRPGWIGALRNRVV
ncbi:MAG: hypothetical protein ABIJ09_07815 [Pseudomonadota bacterium]